MLKIRINLKKVFTLLFLKLNIFKVMMIITGYRK